MFQLPENDKTLWLEGLRSGQYTQGRTALCNEHGYCCLGVYAQTIHPDDIEWHTYGGGLKKKMVIQDTTEDGRPFSRGGTVPEEWIPDDIQTKLIQMNDTDEMTFAEIADYIEASL